MNLCLCYERMSSSPSIPGRVSTSWGAGAAIECAKPPNAQNNISAEALIVAVVVVEKTEGHEKCFPHSKTKTLLY